jgi:hypothetical protein
VRFAGGGIHESGIDIAHQWRKSLLLKTISDYSKKRFGPGMRPMPSWNPDGAFELCRDDGMTTLPSSLLARNRRVRQRQGSSSREDVDIGLMRWVKMKAAR